MKVANPGSKRRALIETRHNRAKAIAPGYKRGETETATKVIIVVQQTISVTDYANEELEDAEGSEDLKKCLLNRVRGLPPCA
jgi:hypothetical protein